VEDRILIKTAWLTSALLALLPALANAQSVLTYHGTSNRYGAYIVPGLTDATAANMHLVSGFAGAVNGAVYAQPLYWQPPHARTGQVIVATETNAVYALDGVTGAVVWQTQLGAAVPHSALPCGNINPEGVTGTPVIDAPTKTLYLDALTAQSAGPRHTLYALSLTDGHVLAGWPIDLQATLAAQNYGFLSTTQGQRSAAMDMGGDIYFAYGGRSGDCGTYHGTVVQIHPATKSIAGVWATGANRGGIWSQGGLAQVGKSLLVATGNTDDTTQWTGGEAIIRLRAGLAAPTSPADYYAPSNWLTLDNEDADLGGTEALPLRIGITPDRSVGRVISFGKDGNAYLANEAYLGGVGGVAVITPVASGAIITAPSVYSTTTVTMVALTAKAASKCSGQSVIMLNVAGRGATPITQAWCQPLNGRGAPIVTTTDGAANPIVWVTGAEGDDLLHGFDALTGAPVFSGGAMANLRHFQTILAAGGMFYVASDNRIYAFAF
jgi:outer membrane protein assembly factor BamB